MKLYHGSNRLFKEFKISKELKNFGEDVLAEGIGIYMTENKNVASSYGAYIYEIEVDEKNIFDATSEEEIINIIRKVSNLVDFDIENMIDIYDLCEGIKEGDLSVTELYKEINDLLDSKEELYINYADRVEDYENGLFGQIEKAYLNLLPSIIKYNDKSLGVVYICKKDENKIIIKNIEKK